ncbi:hypothetical protein [Longibacter sp.]|uniref:hypothetical protein n=1 Tax=Longibacter sp. TaxID=2045415 RepID=UPI003EB7C2DA
MARTCLGDGARDRFEYTYVAETDALRQLNRNREALDVARDVLEKNVIQQNQTYVPYVLESAAHAALSLGKDALSVHYFNLAALESEGIDPLHRFNNERSLALLQIRVGNPQSALRTANNALEALKEQDFDGGEAIEAKLHFTAAAALMIGCDEQGAGATAPDPNQCGRWQQALRHQEKGTNAAERLSGTARVDARRSQLSNEFLIARARGEHRQALALIEEAAALGQKLGDQWTQFQSEYRQALIRSDQGRYSEALQITSNLADHIRTSGQRRYLPYLLNVQVQIAASANDMDVAREALQQLAAMDDEAPDTIYREASATYASVFGAPMQEGPYSFWMLLSIAVGVSVVLQFIGSAARRHYDGTGLFEGRVPAHAHRDGTSEAAPGTDPRHRLDVRMPEEGRLIPHPPAASASPDHPTTPEHHAPETDRDDLADDSPSGDGFCWADEDAEWMQSIGINIDDLPVVEPHVPAPTQPSTLGDMLRETLRENATVPVYGGDGAQVETTELSQRVIDHATTDRFIAIEMSDTVVIAYRYARPQKTIVRQTPDGRMETVQLDRPVTAVPVAVLGAAP